MAPPATGPRISVWKAPAVSKRAMRVYFAAGAVIALVIVIVFQNWEEILPVAIVIALAGLAQKSWNSRFLLEVYDLGDGFLIKDANTEFYVDLAQIHHIDAQTYDGGHFEVVLELNCQTRDGGKISFFPTPEAMLPTGEQAYLEYLRQRVITAKAQLCTAIPLVPQ